MVVVSITILLVIVSATIGFIRTRVPFVPSPAKDIEKLIKIVEVKENHIVYDLGSGDGSVLEHFWKSTGNKNLYGYELTGWTYLWAKIKAFIYNYPITYYNSDFFKSNLSRADIIYCYLYPPLMRFVGDKVRNECKPGTIIMVRDFPIPNLNQTNHILTEGDHELFIYSV